MEEHLNFLAPGNHLTYFLDFHFGAQRIGICHFVDNCPLLCLTMRSHDIQKG